MSQHDYNIANSDGATVRADINSAFEAIQTVNSGATAPATTFAGQLWWDTANNLIKRRNSANTSWITVAFWDGTNYRDYGAKPTFHANKNNAAQASVPPDVYTLVTFGTEVFDVGGWYDHTAHRVTPTIACKMRISATIQMDSTNISAGSAHQLAIFKDGTRLLDGPQVIVSTAALSFGLHVSAVVDFNGSTNYADIRVIPGGGVTNKTINGDNRSTYFQAEML